MQGYRKTVNSVCSGECERTHVYMFRGCQKWQVRRPYFIPEISRAAVLLGHCWSKVPETNFVFNLFVPCVSSHRIKFSCRVWDEPLVPQFSKGGCSPPRLIVSIPVEEFGSFYKLIGVAVSRSTCT